MDSKAAASPVASFQCDICAKSFSKAVYLKKHKLIHTGERRFKCEICGKTCLRNGDLKKHMVKHTGEKRYQCDICAKTFSQTCHLKEHLLVHSSEKPISCNICWKCFKDSRSLRRHLLVHMGQNPFRCLECSKIFPQSADLRTHMLVIHCGEPAYCCGECSNSYAFIESLKNHMKVHTTDPSLAYIIPYKGYKQNDDSDDEEGNSEPEVFRCDKCFRYFSQDETLKKHLLIHEEENLKAKAEANSPKRHMIIRAEGDCLEYVEATSDVKPISKIKLRGLIALKEKRYRCGVCSKCFCKNSNLKRHMLIHAKKLGQVHPSDDSKSKKGSKKKSGKRAENSGSGPKSKTHMVIHPEEERLDYIEASTSECDDEKNLEQGKSSRNEVHSDCSDSGDDKDLTQKTTKTSFKCQTCSAIFSQESHLKKHMLIHVKGNDSDVDDVDDQKSSKNDDDNRDSRNGAKRRERLDDELFKCGMCCENFSEERALKEHIVLHAEEKDDEYHSKDDTEESDYCNNDNSMPYSDDDIHNDDAEDDELYKCGVCSESFSEDVSLKKHMLVHTESAARGKGDRRSDDVIIKRVRLDDSDDLAELLKLSRADAAPEKVYRCNQCPKTFNNSTSLSRHILVHTDIKQFECDQCSKSFTLGEYLRAHKTVVHSENKPYICGECSKSFAFNAALRTHMMIHTGQRPYQCQNCSKSFALKGNLKRHVLLHCN